MLPNIQEVTKKSHCVSKLEYQMANSMGAARFIKTSRTAPRQHILFGPNDSLSDAVPALQWAAFLGGHPAARPAMAWLPAPGSEAPCLGCMAEGCCMLGCG